jgi:hypothetical protein
MEENCEALFRHYKLEPIPKVLLHLVDRTIFVEDSEWMEKLLTLVPHHFEAWPFNRNHGLTAVRGWRERRAKCSMQLVLHSYGAIEADFDLYNPNHGILPALGHLFLEVCKPGKTNSFGVMKKLRKRGVAVKDVRKEL